MRKRKIVKEASVLLIFVLMLSSVGAMAANIGSRTATCIVGVAASGNTWYVDDDNTEGPWEGTQEHPFQHIQEALDSDLVKNGDTICVASGTYYGGIHLLKQVNLIGENKETTIIDGTGYDLAVDNFGTGYPLSLNTISSFTIKNGDHGGIGFMFCNSNTITDNIFINNGDDPYSYQYAIEFFGCNSNTITGNTFIDNNGGIMLEWHASFNTITDNTFSNNNKVGIAIGTVDPDWADACIGNTVTGNTITYSDEAGIYLACRANTIGGTGDLKNIISDNEVGIKVFSSSYDISTLETNNEFSNNHFNVVYADGISQQTSTTTSQSSSSTQQSSILLFFQILQRLMNIQ